MEKHRNIKFYGVHDMSSGYYLREAETFFQNWDEYASTPDLNTIIELYNIKKYFDVGMRLEQWNDEQFAEYKEKCQQIPQILGRFCNTISDANLEELYQAIDRNYTDDFWQLFCGYKVYRRISSEILGQLLDSDEYIVWEALQQRELITTFGQTIAYHLSHNIHTAEHLISHFLAAHERSNGSLYFPVEFTQEMRDKVLADFVEREDANLNSLQLLEQGQSTKEFPISDRLRLKARKKKEALQEKLFAGSPGMAYGAEVTFKSIPDGSVEESFNDNIVSCAYSREWIEGNQDYPTLLNNFVYLFKYVDRNFRCAFVSLEHELGVFERHLGVKGKKDYVGGIAFSSKQMLSLLQMAAYNQELQRLDIRLEDIFKWFFEEYLKSEFGANGFTYTPPSAGTTYAEKCKLLAIAIDGALKQYRLYCEDGFVDRELLEMSSGHIAFCDLLSIIENKYAYSASDELQSEMFLLFSDQSMMSYTAKTGERYQTMPQLLLSEHMRREDFAAFQHSNLDWLVERGSIKISEDGYLSINKGRIFILKDLFCNEVICPRYYGEVLHGQIESLVETGDLRYENTLFSKPEQDYLNYILNKSEFSNGLDLRNKYSHDTCSLDEKTQSRDYLELQKIMVLIIIKINEEFCKGQKIEVRNCLTNSETVS